MSDVAPTAGSALHQLSAVELIAGFRAATFSPSEAMDAVLAAELASPLNDPERPFEHIGYTVPWNMAENPAASINGGYDGAGFPIGVQIVGRRFDDLGVLRLAKAFERLRGPQRPWPQPPGA